MNGISESEKKQLRESVVARGEATPNALPRAPSAPLMSMTAYLRQIEEWARLFPPVPRAPARGTHWKL